jgi:hypothetical protein
MVFNDPSQAISVSCSRSQVISPDTLLAANGCLPIQISRHLCL